MRDEQEMQRERDAGTRRQIEASSRLPLAASPRRVFPSSLIPHPSSLLDRGIIGCLFLMSVAAPHSIAATQVAWGVGLLLWFVRFFMRPRPKVFRTPIDYALLGLFILTFISALFSYNQTESIGKLRSASLFTIVYLVAENVASRRVLRLLVLTLVASCLVNVIFTFGEYAVGRGVKVDGLRTNSPLFIAGVRDGDTILEVDGTMVSNDRELIDKLASSGTNALPTARVRVYRVEAFPEFAVARGRLLDGATPATRLGFARWSAGRDWRAAGFYGHYVTYAEVLQLIASLALGLFIARRRKWSWSGVVLVVALLGFCGALLLTVTRATWLGLLVSAFVIVLIGASRRTLITMSLVAVPLVIAGLFVLQQKRQVGFLDKRDGSTAWRLMVYREGVDLLFREPRHIIVGVGMDSIKTHYREFDLFDHGRQAIGHLHSTPLQLAVERGLPAMFVWLALIVIYARMLWRLARDGVIKDWVERGLVLGALGGLAGFVASGMVHYNLGDSEVSMIFYFVMGLTLVVERWTRVETRSAETVSR